MVSRNLAAFDSVHDNLVFVDDAEVLVHGGSDEAPLWRRTLGGTIVGVGAGGGRVVTLDETGDLVWWNAGGERGTVTRLPEPPQALDVSRSGARAAVLLTGRVALVGPDGGVRMIPAGGCTAVALSWSGHTLAIGTEAGEIRIVSPTGELVGNSRLDGAVRSLAASPRGHWYATSGDRVIRVPEKGGQAERVTRASGYEPDCLAVSDDGTLFAARLGPTMVISLGDPPGETVVQLKYVDREANGVAFCKGRVLGVALVGGDANFAHVAASELRRSDTFEGRQHNRWMVQVVIEPEAAPPVPAAAPAPLPPPPLAVPPQTASTDQQKGSAVVGILGLVVALLALGGLVYWRQSDREERAKKQRDEERDERIRRDVGRAVRESMDKQRK